MGARGGGDWASHGRPSRSKSTINFTAVFLHGFSAKYARLYGELYRRRLEELHAFMIERTQTTPARAAQEALRQLVALGKDIPVMRVLSNPHLKAQHWRKVRTVFLAKDVFGVYRAFVR